MEITVSDSTKLPLDIRISYKPKACPDASGTFVLMNFVLIKKNQEASRLSQNFVSLVVLCEPARATFVFQIELGDLSKPAIQARTELHNSIALSNRSDPESQNC